MYTCVTCHTCFPSAPSTYSYTLAGQYLNPHQNHNHFSLHKTSNPTPSPALWTIIHRQVHVGRLLPLPQPQVRRLVRLVLHTHARTNQNRFNTEFKNGFRGGRSPLFQSARGCSASQTKARHRAWGNRFWCTRLRAGGRRWGFEKSARKMRRERRGVYLGAQVVWLVMLQRPRCLPAQNVGVECGVSQKRQQAPLEGRPYVAHAVQLLVHPAALHRSFVPESSGWI